MRSPKEIRKEIVKNHPELRQDMKRYKKSVDSLLLQLIIISLLIGFAIGFIIPVRAGGDETYEKVFSIPEYPTIYQSIHGNAVGDGQNQIKFYVSNTLGFPLSTLTQIDINELEIQVNNLSYTKGSISLPFSIKNSSIDTNPNTLGTGIITYEYLSSRSGNDQYRRYHVTLSNFNWNLDTVKASATSSYAVYAMNFTPADRLALPMGYLVYKATGYSAPSSGTAMLSFSNDGSTVNIPTGVTKSGVLTVSSKKGFINTIRASKSDVTGFISYYIDRNTGTTGTIVGTSNATVIDSTTTYLLNDVSNLNRQGIIYTPPLRFTIIEPSSGTTFIEQFFSPNMSATLNPTTIPISQNSVFTIISDASLNGLMFIKLTDETEGTTHPLLYSTGDLYVHNYLKNSSGYWNAYTSTGYNINRGSATPNNLELHFTEGGNRTVKYEIIDNMGNEYTGKVYVTVNAAGSNRLTQYPIDYTSGNFVSGALLSIRNEATKVWTNKTVYTPADCSLLVNTGFYRVIASASGYLPTDNGVVYVGTSDVTGQIVLIPSTVGTIGDSPLGDITNSTVILKLLDQDTMNPISGATATINGVQKLTSYTGSVTFNLQNNTEYKVDFVANGYNNVGQYFTPHTNPYLLNVITKSGSTIPVTYYTTAPVTTKPTTTTTILPVIVGGVNTSGFDAVECVKSPYPAGWGFIDVGKNAIACSGARGKVEQNLIFALVIMMFCALALAKKARAGGALAGAIIGACISFGLGMLPIWILVAVVILCGLVFAALIKNTGGA